jgi:two-component system chemotaxis response regulator CheY
MRALVIDDSRTIRTILEVMLTTLGFEVDTAVDGRDALAAVTANGTPDLILVDWNMPVLNGLGFVEAVRVAPFDVTCPIVMVTTESEIPQIERALNAGADEYLMKPFTLDGLTDKLSMLGLVSA